MGGKQFIEAAATLAKVIVECRPGAKGSPTALIGCFRLDAHFIVRHGWLAGVFPAREGQLTLVLNN